MVDINVELIKKQFKQTGLETKYFDLAVTLCEFIRNGLQEKHSDLDPQEYSDAFAKFVVAFAITLSGLLESPNKVLESVHSLNEEVVNG